MRRTLGLVILATMFLFSVIACGVPGNAPSSNSVASSSNGSGKNDNAVNENTQTITLNAVSFLPVDDPLVATLEKWIENVNTSTEGRVKVDWKGGAEVIPDSQQVDAVQSGVIDIAFTFTGMYETQAPEVLGIPLSQLQPWEERESGFYDLMVKRHEKIDLRYLGRWLIGDSRLWLKEPVTKLEDLEGLKIRTSPNYNRVFPALGINGVLTSNAETYTALQTGIAEGFSYGGWVGPRAKGWTDSTKYILDHPIFWSQNCTILVNLDKWETISQEDQEAIEKATEEYERYMVEYYNDYYAKERKELEKIGVEFIQFDSEDDVKKLNSIVNDVEWEYVKKTVPDLAEEMRVLVTKK